MAEMPRSPAVGGFLEYKLFGMNLSASSVIFIGAGIFNAAAQVQGMARAPSGLGLRGVAMAHRQAKSQNA